MKCNHCQSEWTTSSNYSAKLINCPFCGNPLLFHTKASSEISSGHDPQLAPTKRPQKTPPVPVKLSDFKITGKTLKKYRGSDAVVYVPNGIEIIGEKAFYENESIRSVTLPDSVRSIGESAFSACSNLRSVNLPVGLASMGNYAFFNSGLEKVTVPGTVKKIPQGAFIYCKSLTELVLCEGVEELGEYALWDCPNLRSITIPDSLNSIYPDAPHFLDGTDNIQVINASESWKQAHPHWFHEFVPAQNDADNFRIERNVLVAYYGRAAHPVIPAGVRTIGSDAFKRNCKIEEITIPEGVTHIDEWAFSACSKLSTITFSNPLIKISEWAFSGGRKNRQVNAPLLWKLAHPILMKKLTNQ